MVDEVARGLCLFGGASSEVRRCGCRGTTEEAEGLRPLATSPTISQPCLSLFGGAKSNAVYRAMSWNAVVGATVTGVVVRYGAAFPRNQ